MAAEAVVVAAGSGERLGAGLPKALVPLRGEPLVVHAARACARADRIDAVVVVAGVDHLGAVRAALEAAAIPATVVAGGATRQASVRCGLEAATAEVVAVHDAARALVSPALVDWVVAAFGNGWDAVAPAIPVADTLKEVEAATGAIGGVEQVHDTVDRRLLRAVQTPQVFRTDTLRRAHDRSDGSDASDDLVLVERIGGRVGLVEGSRSNLKITYPEDLRLAALLLAADQDPGEGAS